MKFHRCWLATTLPLLWAATPASALEWELSTTTTKPAALQWQLLPERTINTADLPIKLNYTLNETSDDENTVKINSLEIIPAIAKPYATTQLAWEPVAEADVITPEQVAAEIPQEINRDKAIANAVLINNHSGPTYANYRALWRDGDWLPQISNTVPVGFGPQGVMASLNYRFIDCITGAGRCTMPDNYRQWLDKGQSQGDAFFDFSLGFGDSLNSIGVVITDTIEGTAFTGPRAKDGFLSHNNLGFHLTKSIGPDTSFRIGADNLVREKCEGCGLAQSAYGVLSQRFRLNSHQESWLSNLYLTIGGGNGSYRSLYDQIQASYLAQRAAGCSTYGYTPLQECSTATRRRAVVKAYDWGTITPLASLGLEVFKGFNLITEWSGRNLNAGLSIRPFPELGLVITPMLENLVANCDYGCRVPVPGYPQGAPLPNNVLTDRPRFGLQVSLEFKF